MDMPDPVTPLSPAELAFGEGGVEDAVPDVARPFGIEARLLFDAGCLRAESRYRSAPSASNAGRSTDVPTSACAARWKTTSGRSRVASCAARLGALLTWT